MFSIEPPKKITKGNYICANKYYLDDLIPLFQTHESYGGVLIEGSEFRLYQINDFECTLLVTQGVTQMNNHNKGGQSAPRFRRLRENKRDRIVDFISDEIYESFWDKEKNESKVQGLIIAGSGDLKNQVMGTDLFKKYFKNSVICVRNLISLNDQTIHEIYSLSKNERMKHECALDLKVLKEMTETQSTRPERLVYGLTEVHNAIENRVVKKIICTNQSVEQLKALITETKIELVNLTKCPDQIDQNYGGCVGILY